MTFLWRSSFNVHRVGLAVCIAILTSDVVIIVTVWTVPKLLSQFHHCSQYVFSSAG